MMDNKEKEKNRRVYTTEMINQLVKDRNEGYDIDYSPFFERDLDLRAPNVTFKMTEWEYAEYVKCYSDPLYFITNYCKFKVDGGYKLVKLRDYQEEMIKLLTDEYYSEDVDMFLPTNRNVIICASRQIGKTTTLCSIIAHKLCFNQSYSTLLVANTEKTSIEIVSKLTEIFRNLPYFLKPGCISFGKTAIKLDNGSQILSSATTNTASIGFTINFVLLDEFAHVPENIVNNFWRSIYPTLSSSKISQCAIISTPNGTTNKYYEIWEGSINGQNSFKNMRIDFWRVPGRDQAWADQMRKDFGEEEFAQEFELQFNKNSKMLMRAEAADYISKIVVKFVNKPIYIANQYLNDPCLFWHPDFDPNDIDASDKFLFIVDLAEGNGTADEKFVSKKRTPDYNSINIFRVRLNSIANIRKFSNTSCKITDCFRFDQVGRYSCNTEDEIQCAKVCSALCYNLFHDDERDSVRIALEMNFNGKSFFEEFKRHQLYSGATVVRTYHTKPIPGEKQRKRYGFKTTQNKESYCIKGNKMLSKHRIIIRCKDTFEQMKSFGYVRGKLMGIACHDDLSMPVFNHIPRMIDEDSFVSWLQDYLYFYQDKRAVYNINSIIQKWAMDNPDMSDEDFMSLYGLNEPSYDQSASSVVNPYSDSGELSPYASQGAGMTYPGSASGLSPYFSGSFYN